MLDRSARAIRPAFAVLTGLGLIGALAACSPTTPAESEPSSAAPQTEEDVAAPEDAGTGAEESASTYADGSYDAEGSYQSPGGQESVGVSITLEGDIVTDVTVTPEATSGNAAQYQKAFAGGIGAEVIGKDIDSLNVDKVSGSSLTSGGFNDALETIKADALA